MQRSQPRAACGPCHALRKYRWHGTNLRGRVVSHRLVCRIAHDADTHHPRHSHQSYSVHSIAGQLATHFDHGHHYGIGRLSALLASRDLTRICSTTATLLAASAVDVDLLAGANASHLDLAHSQDRGLKNSPRSCRLANRKDESASCHNVHGNAVLARRALSS